MKMEWFINMDSSYLLISAYTCVSYMEYGVVSFLKNIKISVDNY